MPNQTFKVILDEEASTLMTCREADCQQYTNGWVTPLDESLIQHAKLAHWIRTESKRGFTECRSEDAPAYLGAQGINIPAGITVFIFAPGQVCFRQHKDREVIFAHRSGMGTRIHTRPQDFTEHWNEEAVKAYDARRKG